MYATLYIHAGFYIKHKKSWKNKSKVENGDSGSFSGPPSLWNDKAKASTDMKKWIFKISEITSKAL